MEKKIKFSDKSTVTKIIYGSVISILTVTAIVVGIVSASSKSKDNLPDKIDPPIVDEGGNRPNTDNDKNEANKKLAFVSPTVGSVSEFHNLETPVFSDTLGEWRVHTGIDISTEAGASVYASESGVISGIYNDAMLGRTVEITHKDDFKTLYCNLDKNEVSPLKVGDTVSSGDKIGSVGDTAIAELAEEPHLHFEMLYKNQKVDPLKYLTEESKKASLGIK